jgi:uncharacterized protein
MSQDGAIFLERFGWISAFPTTTLLFYLPVSNSRNLFILNVGFIVHQTVGYVRDFAFDFPEAHIDPDLDLTDLTGTVRVTRTTQGLLVQVRMHAKVTLECVRCLSDCWQPLDIDLADLYAFSQKTISESGLILPEDGKIDLGPVIRDEMWLAFPISPLCDPDCLGLCPICGGNLNESVCQHEEDLVDPRLEILKSFLEGE